MIFFSWNPEVILSVDILVVKAHSKVLFRKHMSDEARNKSFKLLERVCVCNKLLLFSVHIKVGDIQLIKQSDWVREREEFSYLARSQQAVLFFFYRWYCCVISNYIACINILIKCFDEASFIIFHAMYSLELRPCSPCEENVSLFILGKWLYLHTFL